MYADGLQAWLKKKGYDCPVILSNQTAAHIPPYPYISFTVTTPIVSDTAGYSVLDDGTRSKQLKQIVSFTVQSDSENEVMAIAIAAYDWMAYVGDTYFSDHNISVLRVGNVTNRDNLITTEYEYRRGFDVEFLLMHTITQAECEDETGYIETVVVSHEIKH